jgi:hypothetical protein
MEVSGVIAFGAIAGVGYVAARAYFASIRVRELKEDLVAERKNMKKRDQSD